MTDEPDSTIQAAIYLLKHGFASYSEIAALAGVKRQTVRWWARKLDPEARQVYLREQWAKALTRAGK
jgi:DNA invertase Pin-like site-specific DNA recombinase